MKLNKNNIQDMLDEEEQEFAVPNNRLARTVAREHIRQKESLNVLHQKRSEAQDFNSNPKRRGPGFH